ncbi:glycosyltransferase family 2 protein [Gammaproteobacteria bacterium]|nr:glycosyltransferase family 2 protein [Gammaproteobacteria bacterium]MDB9842374.1 glycosyltransferase family 2 protein [Gammaproteobacteria bacterium]
MNIDSRHSISIIIPLSDGANYISALFASLKKQTLQPQEIIFVISRLGDWKDARQIIEKEKNSSIKIIYSDPLFPGASRNLGAAQASSDWLAFLDVRTLPSENWLESMASISRETSCDLVLSKMVCTSDTFFHNLLQAATYGNNSVECLPGSIVNKSSFLSSGGFLENVRAGEDWEWINRFSNQNEIIKKKNAVISYHGLPNNLQELIKKWFIYSFENAKVNILLKEKFSYMGLIFIAFAIILYRWNHIVSGEAWNEDALLFIPNLNKLFWSIFLSIYFVYRGLVKPIQSNVTLNFLMPFSWISVGILGCLIDIVKAPGRVYGSIIHLISLTKK